MSLVFTYDGAPLAFGVKPSRVDITARADMGEASFAGVDFEDAGAALTTVGHRPFVITETACSQPVLFTGWTTERGIGRSVPDALLTGPDQRLHDLTAVDINNAFMYRVIAGTDGNRPEEPWADRLTWILESDYLDDAISNSQAFVVTNTTSMDAADYRGSPPSAVFDDLSDRSGGVYGYFLFWDPAEEAITLFFDRDNEYIAHSTISISNVLSDVDSTTCFAPSSDALLHREPDQVYSEVVVEYTGGKVFRRNDATAAAFIRRGTTIQRPYTKRASTANSQGDAWLAAHANEVDRITVSITVPSTAVGLIQAGQSMDVRFSHMPGYESGALMRIISYSPKPSNDVADYYIVALELVAPRPVPAPAFHQAVLCSARIGHANITTNGTYPIVFAGANATDNPTVVEGTLRAVLQDTDGYSGTPGDWQTGTFYELTIPAGLDGTYRMGLEEIQGVPGSDWWLPASPPLPNPQQIPYPYGGVHGHSGSGVAGGGTQTVVWELLKNGTTVLDSQTWTRTGSGMEYVTPSGTRGLFAIADLEEGDTISATVTCSGNGWPFWNLANFFGPDYTSPVGVLFLTMTSPGESSGGGSIPTPTQPSTTITNVPPTVNDDAGAGFAVGDMWIDTSTGTQYVLLDSTDGAAVWHATTRPHATTDDADPTVDDDVSRGFVVGDVWVNSTSGEVFVLSDATFGAAVWQSISAPVSPFSATIVAVFDAGTEAITGQPEVDVVVPASGTITSWTLLADTTGDAVVDIWSDTYGNFPPTDADSITAAALPELSGAAKATNSTLSGWDASLTAGDILRFHLDSSATVKRLILTLSYTRS